MPAIAYWVFGFGAVGALIGWLVTRRMDVTRCIFCGKSAGSDPMMDDNGAIACRACGEAEYAAQRAEGFR